MHMEIGEILDNIYPLSDLSKEKLISHISEVVLPKRHLLIKNDRIEHKLYFVKKGIVRAYTTKDDTEITFWFGKEGDTVVSMNSYINQQFGYENIELLEDCTLYALSSSRLQELFTQDIEVANWGRKFAELELIKTESQFINRQLRSAKERYEELLSTKPDLINRVQVGHIASYLGITPVSLSRIRAQLK
ncbi:CRP-like cAMP-binding protein [Roseivirga pacifica]|uniref:cAMP-binding domain of CRP or a regulatory subunit of cAMP-dependent protein kinases n=2 Tax=Roseivirga pacifica TaxID=1267423 RepID=A0A1I0P062_9BACT|nr:Crp/Fnr family transcriptional regulator [Roseivirga pacifica]RKQ51613.1 CRP-like cAMP-binding protein [Roseivirga pacifica]SEW07698.1 cAMP-binding domain of CRP or a regulatory subunit of cAMP-dependent protein kinases [Roseivirga pacifica]